MGGGEREGVVLASRYKPPSPHRHTTLELYYNVSSPTLWIMRSMRIIQFESAVKGRDAPI